MNKTWHEAMDQLEDRGITKCYVAGDITDGNNVYHGHLENLSEIGIEDQTDIVAESLIKHPKLEFAGISGNHDYSFTKENGAKPLAILEKKVDNFRNLGDMRADVVYKGIKFRLLHGAGGRTYALSYPSQTYLRDYFKGLEREDISNGIPHVLLIGHFHTVYSAKDHGIYVIQPGSFQDSDNEYCIRRGLTGPAGLYAVKIWVRDGKIKGLEQEYIQPNLKEKGIAHARTTRNY
jgi:predicted phosphodiesterase